MINGLTGNNIEFQPGEVIFHEGDPGGDLFCIKEGKVEIYRLSGGVAAQLAILGPGEVLGIMTCLTREPRLASARALTKVKTVHVKQGGFKTLISLMPAWVNAVIKDFTVRIKHMDEIYIALVGRFDVSQLECASVQLAGIVATGLSEVGSMQTSSITEGSRIVDVDQAINSLSKIIGIDRARIAQIFEVFLHAGLLKAEPNTAVRRAELAVLERLGVFTGFAQRYQSSRVIREGIEHTTPGDRLLFLKLCDEAKSKKMHLGKECIIPLNDLIGAISDEITIEKSLRRIEFLDVVKLQVNAQGVKEILFTPSILSATIRSIEVVERLKDIERQIHAPIQKAAKASLENSRSSA